MSFPISAWECVPRISASPLSSSFPCCSQVVLGNNRNTPPAGFADNQAAYAGRGLNPRPERSTHARAGEQQTEKESKDSFRGNAFPDLESLEDIWRGWIIPVGGSTPDRLKYDRHSYSNPPQSRESAALRTAMPFCTCRKMRERGPSATAESISTPRLIGPGCITTAPLFKPSARAAVIP